LIGDCPLIESPNSGFERLEDFIFPLSSDKTLICKRGAEKYISNSLFYLQKDLCIFHLSENYVACKSREHLDNIAQTYSTLKSQNETHLLQKYVFDFIA